MKNIAATGAQVIATGNPGCMMQIALGARERGMDLQVVHPVELLDEAYRAAGLYDLSVPERASKRGRQRALIAGAGLGLGIGLLLVRRRSRRRNQTMKRI